MATTYTVIYRTGGTSNYQWKEALPTQDLAQAQEEASLIRRGGRRAYVIEAGLLASVGLPKGFEADATYLALYAEPAVSPEAN